MKPMPADEQPGPAVRLSIQGRHGLFLVQRDAEEVMVDAKDQRAPHCTCRLHHPGRHGRVRAHHPPARLRVSGTRRLAVLRFQPFRPLYTIQLL